MAVAYLQEFKIVDGDTSTTNYDGVVEKMNLTSAPDGLIVHTAGFDHDAGVFRILDEIMAAHPDPESLTPPDRETWYELHDTMS